MPIDSTIRKIIDIKGHITIDEMMEEVMHNNTSAYYKNIEDIGEKGDFITAPEISQLFGEMIGLWIIEQWQNIGSPVEFTLLELGPGQGKLMNDALRTLALKPDLLKAARIKMHDINPFFIEKQKKILSGLENVEWIEKLSNLPKTPLIVISNEFFDSMPVKQYKKFKKTWCESVLKTDPMDGRIKYSKIELNKNLQAHLHADFPTAEDGAVIEESITSFGIIKKLAKHIRKNSGAFLTIDYGYHISPAARSKEQYNPTMQAIKNHEYQSLIDTLGEADLSAHVDFHALSKAVTRAGIKQIRMSTQEQFLKKYGIMIRLDAMQKQNSSEMAEILGRQVYRLTAQEQMGELFKALEFIYSD